MACAAPIVASDTALVRQRSQPRPLGLAPTPTWLDSDGLHGYLLGSGVTTAGQRRLACRRYAALVAKADNKADACFWQDGLRGQIYLGDEAFAQRMQARAQPSRRRRLVRVGDKGAVEEGRWET
jgi:hypothetical protein